MTLRSRLALSAVLAVALASTPVVAATPTADSLAARVRTALGDDSPRASSPATALSDSLRRRTVLEPLRPTTTPVLPGAATAGPNGPGVPASLPTYWQTHAERSNWQDTGDYEETMRYCRQLEAGASWVKLTTFGTSGQGRPLPVLVLSRDRAFTPEAARATGKPVVLIQNGIHAGEIEGKDACLALVRDITVLRTRAQLLDSCIVLVVPMLSADAHERRSPYNRINQNGPAEMGWRVSPTGLNLNRDYVKAESPEMRALLAEIYTRWWPELLIDTHTTDGADYQHDITYGFAHGPAAPAPLERWYVEAFEGRVVPQLARQGHLPAPYLNFRRGNDPLSGIDFGNTPARFSTGYAPLQCRAAILVETHMLKPYGARVQATYDLLVDVLDELRARPRALRDAVRQSEWLAIARAGATDPEARRVALATRTTDRSEPFAFRGKVTTWGTSEITGGPVAHYTNAPWDTLVPLYRETVAAASVTQPAGYLIPQEWTRAIDVLQLQAIHVRRLVRARRDSVEVTRIVEWSADPQIVEGHHPLRITKVRTERQQRKFRPGDVWVPLDQRGAALAIQLCEAQAPDGFMAWNFFDTVLQFKEYGEDYVVEPMARTMLAKDPELAREFATRLATDSTFATSRLARSDFFYRRSPWADPEQNLDPIARALHVVPEADLVPETLPAATGR